MRTHRKIPPFVTGMLLLGILIAGLRHTQVNFIDYPVYERAGTLLLEGRLDDLHDLNHFPPYYYGHLFTVWFAAMAKLGMVGKYLLLGIFLLAYIYVLQFSIQLAQRQSHARIHSRWILPIVVLLSLYAINDALMNANIGLLLLAMGCRAFEVREKHAWACGFWTAAAICFKFYPIVFFFFFVWERRWKVVLTSVFCFFLLYLGLPIALHGPTAGLKIVTDQITIVSSFGKFWPYDNLVFQNIPATFMRYAKMLGSENPEFVFHLSILISSLFVILLFLPTFLRSSRTNKETSERMFVFLLAMVPLVTPVSWYNMALFYVPLISILIHQSLHRRSPNTIVALGLYTLLFCLTTPDLIGRPLNDQLELYGIPFFGSCALVIAFLMIQFSEFPDQFRLRTTRTQPS